MPINLGVAEGSTAVAILRCAIGAARQQQFDQGDIAIGSGVKSFCWRALTSALWSSRARVMVGSDLTPTAVFLLINEHTGQFAQGRLDGNQIANGHVAVAANGSAGALLAETLLIVQKPGARVQHG